MRFAVGVCGMCPKFLRNIFFESFRQVGFGGEECGSLPGKLENPKRNLGQFLVMPHTFSVFC